MELQLQSVRREISIHSSSLLSLVLDVDCPSHVFSIPSPSSHLLISLFSHHLPSKHLLFLFFVSFESLSIDSRRWKKEDKRFESEPLESLLEPGRSCIHPCSSCSSGSWDVFLISHLLSFRSHFFRFQHVLHIFPWWILEIFFTSSFLEISKRLLEWLSFRDFKNVSDWLLVMVKTVVERDTWSLFASSSLFTLLSSFPSFSSAPVFSPWIAFCRLSM